ncbi:proclotting enzyme-like isoform X2 [Haemaphysalis longicornis]
MLPERFSRPVARSRRTFRQATLLSAARSERLGPTPGSHPAAGTRRSSSGSPTPAGYGHARPARPSAAAQRLARRLRGSKRRKNISRYVFRLGDFNKTAMEPGEVHAKGDLMIPHKKFDIQTFRNDIGLVRLSDPVDLAGANANLQTICLPEPHMDFSKARCIATGWGETEFKGRHSDVLMEVMLPVWPHEKCAKAYRSYNKITRDMFCAGYEEGKKSSCSGDSGGPLQCTFDERTWYLVGVVSHSVYCALPNMPTVFTRVASFRDFLNQHLNSR